MAPFYFRVRLVICEALQMFPQTRDLGLMFLLGLSLVKNYPFSG